MALAFVAFKQCKWMGKLKASYFKQKQKITVVKSRYIKQFSFLIFFVGLISVWASDQTTIILGPFDGTSSHIKALEHAISERIVTSPAFKLVKRGALKTALKESKIANSELSASNPSPVNLKIADIQLNIEVERKKDHVYSAYLTAINLTTLEVEYSKSVEYESAEFITRVAAYFISGFTHSQRQKEKLLREIEIPTGKTN